LKTYRSTDFNSKDLLLSLLFLIFLICSGAVLNNSFPKFQPVIPRFPYNISFVIILTSLLAYCYYRFKKTKLIQWLSGFSASIFAITGFITVCIFKFIGNRFNPISELLFDKNFLLFTSDWIFIFLFIYLYICLTFSITHRLFPDTGRYFPFIIIHVGIWILLIGFTFRIADYKEITINLIEKNDKINVGILKDGSETELPFELQLLDFKLGNNTVPSKISLITKQYLFSGLPITPKMKSKVVISQDSTYSDTVDITEFKPVKFKKWNLCQTGYDVNKGANSTLSIITLRRDPWENILNFGIILIILGILLHLAIESRRKIWIQ
jgi:hypothetical protein